jgi:alanyl-tRNA synthetase
LGVASLGVIGRNVVNYVKAEREAEKAAAEKLRREQQERDKLARLERERQERKRKQAEMRKIKQELRAKAEALDYASKYFEAGKLLSDYGGDICPGNLFMAK